MTEQQKLDLVARRFCTLPFKRKIVVLLLILCLSFALAWSLIAFSKKEARRFSKLRSTAASQKFWFLKERQIDLDILNFKKSHGLKKIVDLDSAKELLTTAAALTGTRRFAQTENFEQIEGFEIHRIEVSLDFVTIAALIEFFEKIGQIGDNVAISKVKITSGGNGLLNVNCVISILKMEAV